ncbi:MAG: T9SS type A sorting domain-containing protein [Bacteroidetes bacterium]|nr:T9SS type A sorting domain-containing protein [Bacteroidota bacterium]
MRTILYVSFLIIFSTISFSFSGKGSGAEDDPFQITNILQLQEIKDDLDANYKLMNDIDASETRLWNIGDHDGNPATPDEPMGYKPTFLFGTLNGDGYIIKNLYINRPKESQVALFSRVGGHIYKLGLENCHIIGCETVSGLCAIWTQGIIEYCFTSGIVEARCVGWGRGGLCGYLNGGVVYQSYSSCTVSVINDNWDFSTASFCINPSSGVGMLYCYTTGEVISNKRVSAFGENDNASHCFWDVETTGIPDTGSHEARGLPTSDMKKKATYYNESWNFFTIWCIDEGRDYPKLRAFGKCPPTDVPLEPINENKLNAFPNPAYSSIDVLYKFQTDGISQIIITNSYGQQVYNANVNNINPEQEQRHSIDISSFPSGLYFVTLRSPAVALTQGVVVLK